PTSSARNRRAASSVSSRISCSVTINRIVSQEVRAAARMPLILQPILWFTLYNKPAASDASVLGNRAAGPSRGKRPPDSERTQPMAQSVVVTLEKELPEIAAYNKANSGKALAREADRLDATARRRGVATPTAMLS